MAFGDIMKNLGLMDGKPDESGQMAAQILLEQRNKPTRGFGDNFGRALSIALGTKIMGNNVRAAEAERTKEQKAMAEAMGINPLAYEAEQTFRKLKEKGGEEYQAHQLAGELGGLTALTKTSLGMMSMMPGASAIGPAMESMTAAQEGTAEQATGQLEALQQKAIMQKKAQEEKKRAGIQTLMMSKDPQKQALAMKLANSGKPEHKVMGNKIVEFIDGKFNREVADMTTHKPVNVGKNAVLVHPETKEVLFDNRVDDDPALQTIKGINPETGKEEHFVLDKNTKEATPVNLEVAPNVSTVNTREISSRDMLPVIRDNVKNQRMLDINIGALDRLQESAKPEYFETAHQWWNSIKGLYEKSPAELVGLDLSKEQKAGLAAYRGFEGRVNDFANNYIKSITGAQMSKYEIDRILGAIGNMGDSYTAFTAKQAALRDAMIRTKQIYEEEMKALGAENITSAEEYAQAKIDAGEIAKQRAIDEIVRTSDRYRETGELTRTTVGTPPPPGTDLTDG